MSEQPAEVSGQGYYKPSLMVVKLPRCPNLDCPDPVHPLTREGSYNPAVCPGCGGPAAQPCEVQDVEAVLVGETA